MEIKRKLESKLAERANITNVGVEIISTCRDRPRLKNRTNTEFWQKWNSNLKPGTEIAKTQGSCKLNFHWYQNSQHEPGTDLDFGLKIVFFDFAVF